jgi:hypothetical protein
MIKPTELMINNCVIIEDDQRGNYYYEITPHDLEKMESFEDDYKNNGVLGIPLTPEILEKAGFQLFPWGWIKKSKTDFGVRLQVHSFAYEVSGNNPVKLTYLHQLQNLYFALTGEELNVNLNSEIPVSTALP